MVVGRRERRPVRAVARRRSEGVRQHVESTTTQPTGVPGVIPKWAIIAPIFIPLFYNLGIAPQTVIAAYRVGDGPVNVITPLMVYLPFIILVCQRYRKSAGMGTVVSMMMPYTVVVLVAWTIFFVIWYVTGIPWGPGSPVHL